MTLVAPRIAIVSGASGFIGRRLCSRLHAEGWRVHALVGIHAGRDMPSGPWHGVVAVDVGDREAMRAALFKLPGQADVVFHLAGRAHAHGETGDHTDEYRQVNVDGTTHVLDLAAAIKARRFVLAGSVAAMGPVGAILADETHHCAPTTPYGASKLASETLTLAYRDVLEPVVLRFPMVFGGRDRGNMTRMVEAVRRRRFPPFPQTGNCRSILHVDDAVDALLLGAVHPGAANETFIVTDGRAYSTREIYEAILAALGRGRPWITPPLPLFRAAAKLGDLLGLLVRRRMPLNTEALSKLTDSAAYSNAKIVDKLGFAPRGSLDEGIRSILAEGA